MTTQQKDDKQQEKRNTVVNSSEQQYLPQERALAYIHHQSFARNTEKGQPNPIKKK
jgi:hypothetical protein